MVFGLYTMVASLHNLHVVRETESNLIFFFFHYLIWEREKGKLINKGWSTLTRPPKQPKISADKPTTIGNGVGP
jgi:hypothetical protein